MEQPLTPTSRAGTKTLTLNPQQEQARESLLTFLKGEDNLYRMWLLKGYAGTGKTTTMMQIVKDYLFHNPDANIAVSAPTHKAVSVLRKQQSLGNRVQYATIHSLLGLKENIDHYTGQIRFLPSYGENGPRLGNFDVLILDEVSMLQTISRLRGVAVDPMEIDLFEEIIRISDMYNIDIVMMGDPVQIPPVNATDPIPFTQEGVAKYKIGVQELTQIMRQSGDSPILDYATELRRVYKTGNVIPKTVLTREEGVTVINNSEGDRIKETLQRFFVSKEFERDPDYAKVIAWRNATVDLYNNEIRKMIYKQNVLPKVMEHEQMICDAPVIQPNPVTGNDEIVLHTNDEVLVTEYEIKTKQVRFAKPFSLEGEDSDSITIKYYKTKVVHEEIDNDGDIRIVPYTIDILHEDSAAEFDRLMKQHVEITKKTKDTRLRGRLWKQYYSNKEKFAWMKYNYAITAHKSQGSTYDNVIMLHWDIDKNPRLEERNRIKYVAATRPRHNLFIIT